MLKQRSHAKNSFKDKIFWKIIKKPYLKKVNLFFLSSPVSFNRQEYEKQKRPGTSGKFAIPVPKQV